MGKVAEDDLPEGRRITEESKALIEFGKKALTESINTINEYIKIMIPLTTSIITVYFALLKFLGLEEITDNKNVNITTSMLTEPAFLMLASLITFIIVLFPLLMRFQIANITSVKNYRNAMIAWRYIGTGLGMGFFLYGIYRMIVIIGSVILVT